MDAARLTRFPYESPPGPEADLPGRVGYVRVAPMPNSAPDEALHWYRSPRATRIWTMTLIAAPGIPVSFLLVAISVVYRYWFSFFVGAASFALVVWAVVVVWRSGVGVGRDGVLVRSTSGLTRWVPWTDVERFDLVTPPKSRSSSMRAIAVIRRNAGPVIANGLGYAPLNGDSTKIEIEDLLNALENERRAVSRS
jgi:hypothetical protein